jgi:hypothetical protein
MQGRPIVPIVAALAALLPVAPMAREGPREPVEFLAEQDAEWGLSCTETAFKVERVCSVSRRFARDRDGRLGCGFVVQVGKPATTLRIACSRPVERISVQAGENARQTFTATEDDQRVFTGGSPELIDAILTSLRFSQGGVTLRVLPRESEPFEALLGPKDFDRVYGKAMVVADP